MARHKLSESNLKRLDKPGVYGDGDGLWLRVRKGGSKQWFFIWKRAGQRTEIGLGGYGQGTAPVSLALAREKADAIREKLARGEDPRAEKKPARIVTFADCMIDFHRHFAASRERALARLEEIRRQMQEEEDEAA